MREFYITNGKGTVKNLASPASNIFLNEPKGLGYSQTLTTAQYANTLSATSDQDFGTIDAELIFFNDSLSGKYDKYNKFVDFLTEKPLTISYVLPTSPAQTYTIAVDVLSLDKTEVKSDNLLTCDVSFQCLSRWTGTKVTTTGSATSYTLTNNGHMPVGFEITIKGSLVNPYITLEQDNELYGEAKFIDSTAFDEVYVDSIDGEQNVILKQGGSVLPNPLAYQDLSISNGAIYVTFVKLARGESTLTVGMDSGSITSVDISFTPIYRSV